MKKIFCIALLIISALIAGAQDNPIADPAAQVVFGNARFTVLTPSLIRMEWSENAVFEDNATLGVVNRKLEVPAFTVRKAGRKVTIRTSEVTLTYTGPEKFSDSNLSVAFKMMDNSKSKMKTVTWTPGMDDSGNLLGTTRTLDKFEKDCPAEPYDKGPISRDGWAVIDETGRHLIVPDNSDWKGWVAPRPEGDHCDLYIYAYGHNYKQAVQDYIKIGGQIPLPPKYVFGYWWSRYWQYSDSEFIDIAKHLRDMNIPIDVMVVDMDWHYTWSLVKKNAPKDEYGQRIGWTGYTWQKQLFPNPENFLGEVHNMNIKTSLNLHPASGIQPYEDCYETFRTDYLSRTSDYDGPKGFVREEDDDWGKKGTNSSVPFRISQKEWADAYFNSVIHPLEDQGVDFWWLDWQQWKECKYMPGLSNTFWLNHTFFNDKVRRTASEGIHAPRPLIYHRWGGIGSHRYQIGFSGDTYANWDVLGYLPYFTATASNVGYGYWGHDIGGHMIRGQHDTDAELYTRWLQYGVFTPIFKTHSTKTRFIERRFWMFPEYLDQMRAAIRLRYDLSPYIYNAAHQTTATGISMCRPLYYEDTEEERSYSVKSEFFFGDDILATVIDQPVDSTGLSQRTMWFPVGNDWYDMATGMLYAGGTEETLYYTIDENPYFVKAGAIIPMAGSDIQSLSEKSDVLRLFVAPGDGSSETALYEDDCMTQAYASESALTTISKSSSAGKFSMKIGAREGAYEGMLPTRTVSVILEGVFAPSKVLVNGVEYAYSRYRRQGTWTYDGASLAAEIILPQMDATQEVTIECEYDDSRDVAILRGKKGLLGRMSRISLDMKYVYGDYVDSYKMLPESYLKIAQGASCITESPDDAEAFLKAVDVKSFLAEFDAIESLPAAFKAKLHAQTQIGQ